MTIRLVLAVVAVLAPVVAHAQRFTHVETRIPNGLFGEIVAVGDFNVDGRDDVVLVGYREWNRRHEAEDRLINKAPMRLFFGTRNGSFRPAPSRFRLARVRNPIAVVADFNGDDRPDLAVFDAGIYDWKIRSGIGNPPQLYLSRGHRLVRSSALANAVRRENRRRGAHEEPRPSGPADLHIKAAAAGDIDGDGDVDLWIESSGGENFTSHFMLNRGAANGSRSTETVCRMRYCTTRPPSTGGTPPRTSSTSRTTATSTWRSARFGTMTRRTSISPASS